MRLRNRNVKLEGEMSLYDAAKIIENAVLSKNNIMQQALEDILKLVDIDENISIGSFRTAFKNILSLGNVSIEAVAKNLALPAEAIEPWVQSGSNVGPSGDYAALVLRRTIRMAQVNIRPCAPQYQYPGQVIVGDYVLPVGVSYDTVFPEEIMASRHGKGRIRKAKEALSILRIKSIGQFLEYPDKILKVPGVATATQEDLLRALRNIGVRRVGEKMIEA